MKTEATTKIKLNRKQTKNCKHKNKQFKRSIAKKYEANE